MGEDLNLSLYMPKGFVPEAIVFLAKKNSDFHIEMVSQIFEEWFKIKLIPNVNEGSSVEIDNALYHSRKQE